MSELPQTPPFITEFMCFFLGAHFLANKESECLVFLLDLFFIIFKLCVSVGVCVWVCACEHRCLWRSEEDVGPNGT